MSYSAAALDGAGEIANELRRTACSYLGESTWMGTVQRGGVYNAPAFAYETLGPDLHGGAAGIALFLAEWHAHSGDAASARVAETAARFAARRADSVPHRFRRGLYSGRLGIAFALARIGHLLRADEFRDAAMHELDDQIDDHNEGILLDVMSGAAGAIGAALALATATGRHDLVPFAERLAERIIAAAKPSGRGWSWGDDAIGFTAAKPLTGLAHGAAGMGWALLELFGATGKEGLRNGARAAFLYEASLFSAAKSNWPDLRYSPETTEAGHFGVAWCLGAPGIGLTRIRARALDPTVSQHERDVAAALRAVDRHARETADVGNGDFSLCHGWAGIGDFLLAATRHQPNPLADRLLERITIEGTEARRGDSAGWRCGIQRGRTPSLMLGVAGIGHFLLRAADPSVPSVLLVHGVAPEARAGGA